jgi:thermitase
MAKKWIGDFTILALAALLIPATPLFAPKLNDSKQAAPSPAPAALSAGHEKQMKLAAVHQDMEATARLCAMECSKDFQMLLTASKGSGEAAGQQMQKLMQEHKHMSHVSWFSGKRTVSKGKLPTSAKGELSGYLTAARKQAASGESYESPAFTAMDGSRYVVLGVPDARHTGIGMVGVIKQDIVKAVERHQMRNLRLEPYPAEGNYKIESVLPNSTTDITVRNGEDNGNASHYHVRDVVVHFAKPMTVKELDQVKKDIRAVSVKRLGDTYIFRSKDMETKQLIPYFKKTWQTEYTEPHYLYMTNETTQDIVPNDALYSQYQWNLPSIEAEKGWSISKGNEGVIVAVLDTGVQSDHPDLQNKILAGTNIVDENAAPDDDVGHGTHVAGIIGATVNNGEGVAGVSWYNKIMPVKVLDSSGAGSTYSVAQGIIWAVDNGAKVINMSLGNYAQADFLHDAIKYAYDHDVVMVAASGNDNTERPGYPAAYPEVFAVAATTSKKERADFSNYGDYIDVAAPGDSIASTYPGSQYAALSGTSMASPHVAALAGLIRSVNPELSADEVMEIMRKSAIDLGDKGRDIYFGYGEIDVDRALQAASAYGGALQTYPEQVKRRLERISAQYE